MHNVEQQEDFYWLNEESKTFLSRGYIPNGMTVQQRYRQIADTAERILNQPGFSDKFYNYLAKGYYSLSSPIIANFGLKRALPISCVTGDTWINTANGGKMAKDIQIGDMVLTHKNRYRKVVDVIPTKDKNDIYELTVEARHFPLNITGNHLVLTNKGWVAVEDLDPQVHLIATNGKVEYTVEDKPLENKPGENKTQEELAYSHGVSIAIGVESACNEKLFKDVVLNLPEHLLQHVWKGIEDTLKTEEYSDGTKRIGCMDIYSAMRLYALAKRLGIQLVTKFSKIEYTDRTETKHIAYVQVKRQEVAEDGLIYSPITSLVKTDKVEDVYDFTVEEDHSFSCAGVVVHNCFGSYITDDINGIFDTVSEVAVMNKLGGGTSGYFGAIRARGSEITAGGKSNGTFSFLQIFDKVVSVVNQNGIRRGMFAGYIDIDHADIDEWVDIHTEGNPVQDIYWGVNVSNSFIEKVKNGDKAARNLWAKILSVKTATGIPYLHFIDNVNENKADVYLDKNMKIHASNMCVSADTKILTKEYGYVAIGTKAGEKVTVWNGEEWSENVELVKTGENQKLYAVTLHMPGYHTGKSGKFKTTIRATDYHKWYVQDKDGNIICKRTSELVVNDITETWNSHLKDSEVPGWIIESITEVDGLHDTFCCTEPKRNKVIFNGVLTGNCMEISLPSSADESFVCCLMSMNLLHYDQWKDTDAVKTAVYFLDAVMSEFIEKAKDIPKMEKAVRFAERHRALGLGVLGWHSYLQSKMIPFDGFEAMMKNAEIFKHLREESYQGSKELAELLGEPELLKGYGRRNTTLMAVAPTKSSSFILGQVSQGIEPLKANLFIKDTAKVKTVFKNPFLQKLLAERNQDTPEVWESINKAGGSVAHLSFLTPREKEVFKTFEEINQMSIIQQAAQRQQFIDQGQSINLSIHPDTPLKDINALYLQAMELGVKGIYYQFSKNAAQEFNRELLQCSSCEA